MLYAIIAKDGTDPDAPERRRRVRQRHLDGVQPLVEAGQLQLAGALLDDEGGMIGSLLLLEADSEAAAREVVENDVYTREGVWRSFEVYPFRRAV